MGNELNLNLYEKATALSGAGLSGLLLYDYLSHHNRQIQYQKHKHFMADPYSHKIFAPPYNEAKRLYRFTPQEYKAVLEHERQHIRDSGLALAGAGLTLASIPATSYLSRRYLKFRTVPAIIASLATAFLINHLSEMMAERRADIVMGRRYGTHAISAMKKINRYIQRGHDDLPAPFSVHGNLKQRLKRIRNQF